jgi:hypothetical protein
MSLGDVVKQIQNTHDIDKMDHIEVCERIITLTTGMMDFWKDARGWAPDDAASLLTRSMLEWQSSLAVSLRRWLDASTDGDLILAWANLGALVEGQLKLFLSVFFEDFKTDDNAIRKKGKVITPDMATLEPLRVYFQKNIWRDDKEWNNYIEFVQQRRNAIHAFKNRTIGSPTEWRATLKRHLHFVRSINDRLPYPDDEIYKPRDY